MPAQLADPIIPATAAGGGGGGPMAQTAESDGGALVLKQQRSPAMDLKKIFLRAMRKSSMKTLFKSKRTRPKSPSDLVTQATSLLSYLNSSAVSSGSKHSDKMAELDMLIREMKIILYGNGESEPVAEACTQFTREFFEVNTMRLLILGLPKLNLEARKDATQVVANLQRRPVNSRLIASDYLESNIDLIELLVSGYEDPSIALHYGGMLRECIRHQIVARYVLKSECMKKFFDYIQLPNFDVAADATATFKELMTRHKSTVAEFLSENYSWFFAEFNSKLLESPNYITRRQAIKLLGDMLLDRSNSAIMVRYVSSKDHLRILMNLLRESSKTIQFDAFHVFKLFVANQNKPSDIVNILVANRSKLLRFLSSFKIDKEDGSFEADKAQIVIEITELEPTTTTLLGSSAELSKIASCGDISKIVAASGELNKIERNKTASCVEFDQLPSSGESNKLQFVE